MQPFPSPPIVRQASPLGTLFKAPITSAPWKKPRSFLAWALGASLLAALVGECWLAFTAPPPSAKPAAPPAPPPQAVIMVIDVSGSMDFGGSLDEVKSAAKAYVARQDTTKTRIGLVAFSTTSALVSPLTRDKKALSGALDSLQAEGVTRMDLGLGQAQDALRARPALAPITPTAPNAIPVAPEGADILLFTDGWPFADEPGVDAPSLTQAAADKLRREKTRLVAIGSAEADDHYLAGLTGSPNLVFRASQGNFDKAFASAEKVLRNDGAAQLISSGTQQNVSDGRALLQLAGWNAILGGFLALGLVAAQAYFTKAKWTRHDVMAIGTGALLGALCGAIGQGLFAVFAGGGPIGNALGRLLGWGLLGASAGAALGWSLPNVRRLPILIGGAAGGIAGAFAFAIGARLGGDIAGRWAGALAIGAVVGFMIAVAEVAARRAWISVSFGPLDSYELALGSVPMSVGSNRAMCRVFVSAIAPLAASYGFESGTAFIAWPDGRREALSSGDTRAFGKATISLGLEREGAPASGVVTPFSPMATAPSPATASPLVAPPPQQTLKWRWSGGEAEIPFERARTTLGRVAGNDVVLSDGSVSSRHASLELRAGRWLLTDIGSTNGTFIGDVRLAPHIPTPLPVGSVVRLGALECRFERG